MKSETQQNLFMYALAGLLAFLLTKSHSCHQKPAEISGYVMKYDTVQQYIQVEGPTVYRVQIKRDTVFDTLIIEVPAKESRVTDEVPHPMQPMPGVDTMRVYEGQKKGQDGRCDFRYTIAVANDSLQFVNIEAQCQPKTEYVTLEVPALPQPSLTPHAPRPWRVGPKVAWSPQDGHTMYGAQAMWRTVYASANYVPVASDLMLEVGFLWPIGKKKTQPAALYGFQR